MGQILSEVAHPSPLFSQDVCVISYLSNIDYKTAWLLITRDPIKCNNSESMQMLVCTQDSEILAKICIHIHINMYKHNGHFSRKKSL